jgi:F420-dependent oxidoreductase-like protein
LLKEKFEKECMMKIGLQIPRFSWPGSPDNLGEKLTTIARTADEVGFSSIWVMDHYFQIRGISGTTYKDPMLEGYTALSFMASVTQHVRLGTMVTGANYRLPGFLVKVVSTLDVLSGGRAWLGIGAGWNEQEALGLGLPFPPMKERFERLEETLQIAQKMWSGDFSAYDGKHYHLAEPVNSPQPLSKPHPPILIGGSGEQKTLRLVAQYANACNLFPVSNEVLAHKLDVLKHHCDIAGRNYADIEKTILANIHVAPSGALAVMEFIDNCKAWARLGIQHVIISDVPTVQDIKPLEVIGRDVIPAVAEL